VNKRGLFFCCCFLCLSVVSAQGGTAYPDIAVDDGHILRGAFTQTQVMQGFDRPLVSTGHFVLAPKRGIRWSVEAPFPSVVTITPDGLTQESNGTVTKLKTGNVPKLKEMYHLIQGVLEGNWQALGRYFTLRVGGDAAQWHVRLIPIKDEPGFPYAAIAVAGGRFVERVEMRNKSGDMETIDFSAIKPDTAPDDPDTLFTPTP